MKKQEKPPLEAAEAEIRAQITTLTTLRGLLDEAIEAGGLSGDRVTMAGTLSNRIALLSSELRKSETHVKRVVGAMTVTEQVEMLKSWFDDLPPAQKDVFRAHVAK